MRRARRPRSSLAALRLVVLAAATLVGCSGTLVPVTPPPATPTPRPEPTGTLAAATVNPSAVASPSASSPIASATHAPSAVALAIDSATGPKDFHYAVGSLEAPAGSTITLTFSNKTDPDDEVGHDWVLVKPGSEDHVLASGIAAGDDGDWLDASDPGIIAASRLIEGKQKDTIKFAAPPPGTYTFLCTFPEHYQGGMKGTLTVS